MKISWIDPIELVQHELRQQREQGGEVAPLQQRWNDMQRVALDENELRQHALTLLHEIADMGAKPKRDEPSDIAEIAASRPARQAPVANAALSEIDLYDRILGGWLGRAAGCALGKPVEKHPRAVIRQLLESNGAWPLSDYITAAGMPQELLQKFPWNRHSGRESLRENLECMPEDDDMNYPMLNLRVLEIYGLNFTTENIAECWLSMLPVLSTFTAERVAYLNLLQAWRPPQTATRCNPYREWIGAQIRADLWGWISPGDPKTAAGRAWRDARLSHTGNGIYGEMFFAAAISAAFVVSEPRQIIAQGLQQIPQESRLAQAIEFVLALYDEEKNWEKAVDRLYEEFGHYHWVHTINNAALAAAALLYSDGDYERAICYVVMGGWDTDSNGATVGSILGTMRGAKQLPEKWIAPLHNRIRSSLKGFDNAAFDDLARRTMRQAVA